MSQRIPDRLDPWRYADLAKVFGGTIRLGSFPRLSLCLLDAGGDAEFDLRFGRDAERRATLTGAIRGDLVLECQRCLEAVVLSVEARVSVAFVEGIEQADRLPESLDPCLVEEARVSLRDLIEDELLLHLPQVAMHRAGGCAARLTGQPGTPLAEEDSAADNPFAVLAELKRDK